LADPQRSIARRRNLPQEELALIDALRLLIGPAFAAAMQRSASADEAGEASAQRRASGVESR
jgi:hypothetical protein